MTLSLSDQHRNLLETLSAFSETPPSKKKLASFANEVAQFFDLLFQDFQHTTAPTPASWEHEYLSPDALKKIGLYWCHVFDQTEQTLSQAIEQVFNEHRGGDVQLSLLIELKHHVQQLLTATTTLGWNELKETYQSLFKLVHDLIPPQKESGGKIVLPTNFFQRIGESRETVTRLLKSKRTEYDFNALMVDSPPLDADLPKPEALRTPDFIDLKTIALFKSRVHLLPFISDGQTKIFLSRLTLLLKNVAPRSETQSSPKGKNNPPSVSA